MPREFKTILCPTDFSEESYRAIEYAERFAREGDAMVLLVHIIHVPSGELYKDEGHVLSFEEGKGLAFDQLKSAHAQHLHGYAKCDLIVDFGAPAEQVLALASQRNVDLIVLSTHGRSSLKQMVLGSVAEEIIRQAPCPVFVVRRGAE